VNFVFVLLFTILFKVAIGTIFVKLAKNTPILKVFLLFVQGSLNFSFAHPVKIQQKTGQ